MQKYGTRAEGAPAMGVYHATMSSKSTRTPRLDTDYTGALIPSPRDQDQRIWPGLHWASHQQVARITPEGAPWLTVELSHCQPLSLSVVCRVQAKLDSFDAWVRDKDVQVEQNERNMMALHRAQEAQATKQSKIPPMSAITVSSTASSWKPRAPWLPYHRPTVSSGGCDLTVETMWSMQVCRVAPFRSRREMVR